MHIPLLLSAHAHEQTNTGSNSRGRMGRWLADILLANKNKGLREMDGDLWRMNLELIGRRAVRRWIRWRVRWSGDSVFKRSIDHALNTLKAHTYSDRHSHTLADYGDSNVAWRVGSQELGKYMFRSSTDTDSNDNLLSRNPSLPHIYNGLPILSSSSKQVEYR